MKNNIIILSVVSSLASGAVFANSTTYTFTCPSVAAVTKMTSADSPRQKVGAGEGIFNSLLSQGDSTLIPSTQEGYRQTDVMTYYPVDGKPHVYRNGEFTAVLGDVSKYAIRVTHPSYPSWGKTIDTNVYDPYEVDCFYQTKQGDTFANYPNLDGGEAGFSSIFGLPKGSQCDYNFYQDYQYGVNKVTVTCTTASK